MANVGFGCPTSGSFMRSHLAGCFLVARDVRCFVLLLKLMLVAADAIDLLAHFVMGSLAAIRHVCIASVHANNLPHMACCAERRRP